MATLGKTTGNNLPGRGLINPAFVIKIVPATDNLQQQPTKGRDNQKDDYLDNLNVGSTVSTEIDGETVTGTVVRIEKNDLGDGVYVIMKDHTGKEHKIEGSRTKKVASPSGDDSTARLQSSPATFNESKILSFKQFSNR